MTENYNKVKEIVAKDGTFRFADKKPIPIKKFRQYRKRKEVSQMRKEIVH